MIESSEGWQMLNVGTEGLWSEIQRKKVHSEDSLRPFQTDEQTAQSHWGKKMP